MNRQADLIEITFLFPYPKKLMPASLVRWRILALLLGLGALAYFQQKSLTVAAERIMPEFQLSQMQLGWLQWAFLLGYTSFQFLGGVVGQRLGPHRMLVFIGGVAFLATLSTPLAPLCVSGTGLFAALFIAQLVLGLAQAPINPVSAGVIQVFFPARLWACANGLQTLAMHIGAALVPPLIVSLMQRWGWQQALAWTALPAIALITLWASYGRDTPQKHPAVTNAELAELEPADPAKPDRAIDARRLARLLSTPSLLLINLSYFCMNYVFYLLSNWCFLYLVQERHFTVLQSGWLASLPPLGAAVGAGIGGRLADALCERYGASLGYRIVPLAALPAAGLLLSCAVYTGSAYLAVAALTLCFVCVELTEGAYWAATMRIAGPDTMAATGAMNTAGNLGGLVGIPIIAYFSGRGAWSIAFAIGTLFAIVSAAAWLGVDATPHAGRKPAQG